MASTNQFPSSLDGNSDLEKFHQLSTFTYKQQAVWFLNAFWASHQDKAETLWNYVDKAAQIDNAKAAGNALDEMEAHRFLETFDEAHTVLEMRNKLRKVGAIGQNERPKNVPLVHYLLFKYDDVDWHTLVNAAQGDNSEEIAKAQAMMDAVQKAFEEVDARAKDAKAREAEAREAEAPFKAACEELQAARDDVEAQEKARNDKTEQLKKASEEGGVVSRNRAKVQLDAHLAEDPLPLRKAKLTLEAAQKKADKARAPFQEKTEIAEAARLQAEEAVEQARQRMAEAEAFLQEAKKKPGCANGSLWWMDREIYERKKFLPTAKGGVR